MWISSVGCTGDEESDLDDEEAEEVGEAQQALLGDMDCVNGTADVSDQSACDLAGGDVCGYTTGTNNYGDDWTSGEDCQEYLVVKTFSPGGGSGGVEMDIRFQAACVFNAGEAPTTQADCERLRLEVAAYDTDENNGNMRELRGTNTAFGSWTGSSCFTGWATLNHTLHCVSGQCERSPALAARCYQTPLGFGIPPVFRVAAYLDRTDI
jgi:hypothetical protein